MPPTERYAHSYGSTKLECVRGALGPPCWSACVEPWVHHAGGVCGALGPPCWSECVEPWAVNSNISRGQQEARPHQSLNLLQFTVISFTAMGSCWSACVEPWAAGNNVSSSTLGHVIINVHWQLAGSSLATHCHAVAMIIINTIQFLVPCTECLQICIPHVYVYIIADIILYI